jgi:hypothetical protein
LKLDKNDIVFILANQAIVDYLEKHYPNYDRKTFGNYDTTIVEHITINTFLEKIKDKTADAISDSLVEFFGYEEMTAWL